VIKRVNLTGTTDIFVDVGTIKRTALAITSIDDLPTEIWTAAVSGTQPDSDSLHESAE
jgi:hypothetical protein